jgi:polyisoprenoid-binding protein YceI
MLRTSLVVARCTAPLFLAAVALTTAATAADKKGPAGAPTPANAPAPVVAPATPTPALPPAAPKGAATYKLDGKASEIVILVFRAPSLASGISHDHAIKAVDPKGEVTFDPAAPEASKVSMTLATTTLSPDEPAMRKKYKLEKELSENDRKTIGEHMSAEDMMDVKKYPTASFTSSKVTSDGDKLLLEGSFTIHGVTKPVKFPVKVDAKDGTLTGDGVVKMKQSDFGVKPCSAMLGAIKCADEIELHMHIVAKQ